MGSEAFGSLPVGAGAMGAVVQFAQDHYLERVAIADNKVGYLPVEPGAHRPARMSERLLVGHQRGEGYLREHR